MSQERLIAALQSKNFDHLIKVMNEAKAARYSGHLVPLLKRVWEAEEMQGVDQGFLSHPRVRIEVADFLAQMERSGTRGLNRSAYAQYARKLIDSDDADISHQAILVLGIAGSAEDASVLEALLKQSDISKFRAAAVAISSLCATDDKDIDRIAAGLVSTSRRELLWQTWSGIGKYRSCNAR